MAEWRKAGETINDGERRVIQRLRDGLPPHWVVISNLYLRLSSATVLEIDAVVVGRDGVWALETKDWFGKITGDALHWQLDDGSLRDSPPASIERKAKALHSRLTDLSPVYRNVSKVGLVVIANNDARLKLPQDERQSVFLLDELVPALKSGKHVFGRLAVKLERDNIQQIANALFQARVASPTQRAGNYVLEAELGHTPAFTEFRAHHIFLSKRPARLKRFALTDELALRAERKEQVRLFLRDMDALTLMEAGRQVGLPVVYDFFPDEDSDAVFWMAEEWQDGQTLRQVLDSEGAPLARHREIMEHLCDVLAYCHGHGVVHRNLRPENIVLLSDGRIRLVNFDYARVAGCATISPRKRAQASPYLAPEQLDATADCDQRVDLYALGVLWVEMLTGKPVRKCPTLRGRGLPEEIVTCLSRLLSTSPGQRPATAEEVGRVCVQG